MKGLGPPGTVLHLSTLAVSKQDKFALTKRGILYQKRGILYQNRGILYQNRGILYQKRGVLYQKRGNVSSK